MPKHVPRVGAALSGTRLIHWSGLIIRVPSAPSHGASKLDMIGPVRASPNELWEAVVALSCSIACRSDLDNLPSDVAVQTYVISRRNWCRVPLDRMALASPV